MVDDKKRVDKKTPSEEPKVEDKPVEEPKTEKPASAPAKPADNSVSPAGMDQHGRQLYNVICSSCGKQTQVPFKPSGDRPVYCRDCYMQQKGGGMNRRSER